MTQFFHVYILVSKRDRNVHYTGVTEHLRRRVAEHNRGHCRFTSADRPWRLETAIAFRSEAKARKFEKYLKTGSGREFARHHF
jgi:predicted GIY-YIG superfamily endonuclease